ncbi:hypothetical protein K490DRAFT_45958 [Saccharata proteae CBS 121410]|uniref:Sacsin/Nov domain-containing protein n=1 Tax=Saccharata proteae CBS 121410 TaxID=1314787 RepID=A0A9P4HSA0_9PEZI|nr:hypothetical protein K490DRAFT_45958 [Saccharata proteae CBS 121410]
MPEAMDYARMRELTMRDGEDDAVTVNTRALIDKVLARYSADFTTLRELIQNASDAGATRVSVQLETEASVHVPTPRDQNVSAQLRHIVKHHTLRSLNVSNNGQAFSEADWTRLRCIAEGNPDETKIGAFGVGFYSVFSECDAPFVVSGNRAMAFYWKGTALSVKTTTVPNRKPSDDTQFLLAYRRSEDLTPSPIPDLSDLCKFLTTSLTFLNLNSIELHIDNHRVLQLSKSMSQPTLTHLPKDMGTSSTKGLMKICEITHQTANIAATWLNVIAWDRLDHTQEQVTEPASTSGPSFRGFLAKLNIGTASQKEKERKAAQEAADARQRAISEDVAGESTSTVSLHIDTVGIQTKTDQKLSRELERATKKPPPKQTRLSILTTPQSDWQDAVSNSSGLTFDQAGDLFASALPLHNGRIFIGFPTGQTTGFKCHIFAPSLIPTVERESIDLTNRHVSTWNEHMLEIAGLASRIAFARGMTAIKEKLAHDLATSGDTKPTSTHITKALPATIHLLKQYTSYESTPSSLVGKNIEDGFWRASKKAEILSTCGVLPSQDVRVSSDKLSFLRDFAVIPDQLLEETIDFVNRLVERRVLSYVSPDDVVRRLEDKPLNETELREFLKWISDIVKTGDLEMKETKRLFNAAVFAVNDPEAAAVIPLGSIEYFILPNKYPSDLPFPGSCMPQKFTNDFSRSQLETFGWHELPIEAWLRFLLEFNQRNDLKSMTKDPELASKVLKVVSKQWEQLKGSQRVEVVEILQPHPVMPTKSGMQPPQQTYYSNIKVFDDLPNLTVVGLKPKFLEALGLRSTIDLEYVFARLLADPNKQTTGEGPRWSHMDLVEYLTDVRNSIPARDRKILAERAIWPVEAYPTFRGDSTRLYKLADLYEPSEENKSLRLPVIRWRPNVPYRSTDPKAQFLQEFGLRKWPTRGDIMAIILRTVSEKNNAAYEQALRYLLNNLGRYTASGAHVADGAPLGAEKILPVQSKPFPFVVDHSACVTNANASMFGYEILRADLIPFATAFGVRAHPPAEECVKKLIQSPPLNQQEAAVVFGYMMNRAADIQRSRYLVLQLSSEPIVPMVDEKTVFVRHIAPNACFVGKNEEYKNILDFVDFGPMANAFLKTVGAKEQPSITELAHMVINNPQKVLEEMQVKRYSSLLRNFAENERELRADTTLWKLLKRAPFLLALEDDQDATEKSSVERKDNIDDVDDDPTIKQITTRASASDVVIRDNVQYYTVFRSSLKVAPDDEILENFYLNLGSPKLSDRVQVEKSAVNAGQPPSQETAVQLKRLIVERCPIFLVSYNADSIRHDTKWLDTNLKVKTVSNVVHRLQLPGKPPVSLKMSAGLIYTKTSSSRSYVLAVRADVDFYEVSRELVPLLLKRQNPKHELLILETILRDSLRRLRAKGYDVHRIIAQKERQARLAEEQRSLIKNTPDAQPPPPYLPEDIRQPGGPREQPPPPSLPEDARQPGGPREQPQQPQEPRTPDRKRMPGAFDSPDGHDSENVNPHSRQYKKRKLTREQKRNQVAQQPTNEQAGQRDPMDGRPDLSPNRTAGDVQTDLATAVRACRPHTSPNVVSQQETKVVDEAKDSYCDVRPAQDLFKWFTCNSGMAVFLSNKSKDKMPTTTQTGYGGGVCPDTVLAARIPPFERLLSQLSGVMGVHLNAVSIFYDDQGSVIAFNRGGSLFFNAHYYVSQMATAGQSKEEKAKIALFWWEAFCHEVAHNLAPDHSSRHVFYEGSFVQATFLNMSTLLAGME